ncbi:Y-family DNA polymerase [Aureimonas pseudogalii]|uniref:DNA-directed DNA polymerase n=1 Tax=Aureimonas pseudogalii TaxID=1744844 RepID=A0A7W6E876_9HYPH|nr:protein ImuB [Aureimonas pseudogalii]
MASSVAAPGGLLSVPVAAGSAHRPPARAGSLGHGLPAARWPEADTACAGLTPLALYERIAGADRIVALSQEAEALGLQPGLGVAEARARFPALDLQPADPAADARLLDAVADWCDRYTPLVALDGTDGLMLDVSGCAHLFGGEAALAADLLANLARQGFAAEAALASCAGTAMALVGAGGRREVPPGAEREAVAPLGLGALRLDPALAATLRRLGLVRVGDLLALPRAGLVRRFGADLARRLDEATGAARRPIGPRRPVPLLIHERRLFEPVSLVEDILRLVGHLAARLREDLERRGEGARLVELALFRVDGRVERLHVRTGAPLRDAARIERLFAERLKAADDEIDAGFGYDLVRLSVLASEAMAERQRDLADDPRAPEETLTQLLDRLSTRLGEACVFGLGDVASHRPERAQARRAPAAAAVPILRPALGPRPLRLFETPERVEATAEVPDGPIRQFRWRRAFYRVGRIEGPERIAPEWWREGAHPERDYFQVEDDHGRRYWLFREAPAAGPVPGWFLHGLFA